MGTLFGIDGLELGLTTLFKQELEGVEEVLEDDSVVFGVGIVLHFFWVFLFTL